MRWEPAPRHLDPICKRDQPLLYDGFGYELAKVGKDPEARRRFLEREITRRARLMVRYPEWAEIWGVEIVRRVARDFEDVPFRSPLVALVGNHWSDAMDAAARHWMPKGWEWLVSRVVHGWPDLRITTFDPWAAGERFRVERIEYDQGSAGGPIVAVDFRGGIRILVPARVAQNWRGMEEVPAAEVEPWLEQHGARR